LSDRQDRQRKTRNEVEALAFELAHAWIDYRESGR
jgi:hypothetical protein